jgi:hypothetical protein
VAAWQQREEVKWAGQQQEAEWTCPACEETKWLSRAQCRGCKANLNDLLHKAPQQEQRAPSYAEAIKGTGNTRAREDTLSKIEALQKVVDSMGDNPLLDEHKLKLIAEINGLKKKTTDTRSLAKQLVTLEGWVEREEKRIIKVEEELEASRKVLELRKSDYQLELAKLASLKEAMVKEAEHKDPDVPQKEMDCDVPVLESKELNIRRQLAAKKDDKGVPFVAKRFKELEKEADLIRDRLAKRHKTNVESVEPFVAAAGAASSPAAGAS